MQILKEIRNKGPEADGLRTETLEIAQIFLKPKM